MSKARMLRYFFAIFVWVFLLELSGAQSVNGIPSQAVTVPQPIPSSVNAANGWGGFADLYEHAGNPAIPLQATGPCAGSIRDASKIWYSKGTYYILVTCASSATTPYNPTIAISSSTDTLTWTAPTQVIPALAGVADCAGGTFSPGAFYAGDTSTSTGQLVVQISCITSAANWYNGPIKIYEMTVAPGLSWTTPANYVMANGSAAIAVADQTWELGTGEPSVTGNQGVYAPDENYIPTNPSACRYITFYSGSVKYSVTQPNGFTQVWRIGTMCSTTATGPWTKQSGYFINSDQTAEEPVMLRAGGSCAILTDDLAGLVTHKSAVVLVSSDPTCMDNTKWTVQPSLQYSTANSWDTIHTGAPSIGQIYDSSGNPTNRWLLQYNGQASSGTDARTIGFGEISLLGQIQPAGAGFTKAVQSVPGFGSSITGFATSCASGVCTATLGNGGTVGTNRYTIQNQVNSPLCTYCTYLNTTSGASFGQGQAGNGSTDIQAIDGGTYDAVTIHLKTAAADANSNDSTSSFMLDTAALDLPKNYRIRFSTVTTGAGTTGPSGNTMTYQAGLFNSMNNTICASSGAQDCNGKFQAVSIALTRGTPVNSSETCNLGELWADANFIYSCTATNTIKRAALTAF